MSSSPSPYSTPADPAPRTPSYQPPTSGRPTGVTIFAILNILFGGMGVVGTLFSGAMLLSGGFNMGPNPTLDALQNSGAYRAFFIVSVLLGALFGVALIVSGIGLLKMSDTARKIAIAYAIYAIVAAVVTNLVNLVFVFLPMIDQANAQGGAGQAIMAGTLIGVVVGGMVGLVYPVAILVYFLRPSVRAAFASSAGRTASSFAD